MSLVLGDVRIVTPLSTSFRMKPGRAATKDDLFEILVDDVLWLGRFCIQHLAEVARDDTECDYADEWADEEMRCKVESVAVLRNPGSEDG